MKIVCEFMEKARYREVFNLINIYFSIFVYILLKYIDDIKEQ